MAGFINCQALNLAEDPSEGSLPFDKRRGGFVMGEGAGILILEEYEHAKKRGAKIYAEVVGYANTADAYHITAPDPEGNGAIRPIRKTADEAGIYDASEVYVNAHGTGTHLNDAMETKALKAVFGKRAYELHISSTKSMTGHMMGATGAVEAIASVKAIEEGIIPPTIGYREKDEECDLNYTPNEAVKADVRFAMSTSLGFGGHNACIAFKKYEA
jgi:3-oxoacyl-[acyl-carrier-protein] synthase II